MAFEQAILARIDDRATITRRERLFYRSDPPASILTQPARNSRTASDSDISTAPSAALIRSIHESRCIEPTPRGARRRTGRPGVGFILRSLAGVRNNDEARLASLLFYPGRSAEFHSGGWSFNKWIG